MHVELNPGFARWADPTAVMLALTVLADSDGADNTVAGDLFSRLMELEGNEPAQRTVLEEWIFEVDSMVRMLNGLTDRPLLITVQEPSPGKPTNVLHPDMPQRA